jgi:hypothetical protein
VDGVVLGRPRSAALKLGLDEQAKKIDEYGIVSTNRRKFRHPTEMVNARVANCHLIQSMQFVAA